jgi:hypothetical protein
VPRLPALGQGNGARKGGKWRVLHRAMRGKGRYVGGVSVEVWRNPFLALSPQRSCARIISMVSSTRACKDVFYIGGAARKGGPLEMVKSSVSRPTERCFKNRVNHNTKGLQQPIRPSLFHRGLARGQPSVRKIFHFTRQARVHNHWTILAVADPKNVTSGGKSSEWGHLLYKFA